ncbi:MAG: hypothetical protein WA160_09260 [Pseudobdellovibrio sp.]
MSLTSELSTAGKQQYKNMKESVKDEMQYTSDSYDKISNQVKDSAMVIQKKAKEYSSSAIDYAKENPLYVALGAASIGFIAGAYLNRNKN